MPSSPSANIPRAPSFLADLKIGGAGHPAFGARPGAPRVVPFFDRGEPAPAADAVVEPAPPEPPVVVESLAPPLPPPPPQPDPELVERMARAIGDLRATAARLAEQASADAMEMALLVARRLIEGELAAGDEALFSLVRSAMRRLGESRRIALRLCPADAAAVEAAGAAGPAAGVATARIEIRGDATLSPGDCVVEGDQGSVDGRLSSRLDEVRRILTQALKDPGEVAP